MYTACTYMHHMLYPAIQYATLLSELMDYKFYSCRQNFYQFKFKNRVKQIINSSKLETRIFLLVIIIYIEKITSKNMRIS